MEKQALPCKACEKGTLRKKKKYRLSGPFVFIGYIILVPSVLGMIGGFQMLISTEKRTLKVMKVTAEIREQLTEAEVPQAIIEKVLRRETVPQDQKAALTGEQRAALDNAVVSYRARMFGAGGGAALTRGFSIFLIVFSFVLGTCGWLLTMKKKVLQCTSCGAVASAS